jgi:hypothetical protein
LRLRQLHVASWVIPYFILFFLELGENKLYCATNLSTEFVLQLEHYPFLEIIGKINVNTLAHNYALSISTV